MELGIRQSRVATEGGDVQAAFDLEKRTSTGPEIGALVAQPSLRDRPRRCASMTSADTSR